MSTSNPQPVDELRIGMVKAAIWRNETEDGKPYYNATFGRLYRTESGEWRTGTSFGLNDLLVVAKLADAAHTRIDELRVARADREAE